MKRIAYNILLNVRQVIVLNLLVYVPFTLVILGLLFHSTLDQLSRDFTIATALLSVLVTAYTFQPEDTAALEAQIPLPRPFQKTVTESILLSWLILWIIPELVLLICGVVFQRFDWVLLLTAGVGYATIIFFCGGITLLSVVAGRDSRMGLMVGLAVCAWILRFPNLLPIPYPLPAAGLYETGAGNLFLWAGFRAGYSLLGGLCFWQAVGWMSDTDRLLIGGGWSRKLFAKARANKARTDERKAFHFLSLPLSFPASRNVGLVAYEALISVIKGPVSIVIISLGVFAFLAEFPSFQQLGFYGTLASANVPNLMRWLLAFMLPFVIVVTVSSDRRTHIDQLVLAIISPRMYLAGKLLGICGAVVLSTLVACLPGFVFPVFAALSGKPVYLAAYLGAVILSALPLFIYVSAWGTLIGMLVPTNRPLVLGGLYAIGSVVLFLGTMENKLGNILFPGGQMAARSISYWLAQTGASNELFRSGDPIIVPLSYLLLPLVSTGLQMILFWFLSGKVYERQMTSV
jgi:hypothetical protein